MEQEIGEQPFRMPLDAKYGKAVVRNAFRNAVISGLDDSQVLSRGMDGLMMGAVGEYFRSIQSGEERSGLYRGGMQFIAVVPCMVSGFFDMLGNGAAETDIDDLHTFADTEYRAFPLNEEFQCLKLGDVQFDINIFGTLVFLSEKGGSDIATAWEQKTVEFCQTACIHGSQAVGMHGAQGIFIVDGIFASPHDGDFYRMGNRMLIHDKEILSMSNDFPLPDEQQRYFIVCGGEMR